MFTLGGKFAFSLITKGNFTFVFRITLPQIPSFELCNNKQSNNKGANKATSKPCSEVVNYFRSHPSLFNPLNPELNPICYLLALLAHHFLHVSKIMVKSLTLRLLMSYIYGAHILDVSRSHTTIAPQSVGLLWTSDQLVAETST